MVEVDKSSETAAAINPEATWTFRNLAPSPNPFHTRHMGLDHVLLEFFGRAAAGAAVALIVIFFVSLGIPRRSAVTVRRTNR